MSLPKIIGGIILMFSFVSPAFAHPNHRVNQATRVSVDFHWVWIDGHWSHNRYVKGHYVKRPGKHPRTHHSGWRWINGHYVGHGLHRQWVPGHWKRTRRA